MQIVEALIVRSLYAFPQEIRLQIEFDPVRPSELGIIRYSYSPLVRKFARLSVRNTGEATALQSWGVLRLLDVAFSQPTRKELQKLPEPAFGQGLTSGRPCLVSVGSTDSAKGEYSVPIPREGCWIANSIALTKPCVTAPGYMPPGRYVVEVTVGCENGQGDTECFEIISPSNWRDMEMVRVAHSQAPCDGGETGTGYRLSVNKKFE